ncbi:MAG TPA: DNA-3-methyladenine glycosylase [Actinomycetota bacterium]
MGRLSSAVLARSFYARPSLEVARDLLGRVLVRTPPDGTRVSGRIVEAEAYRQDDPASHSFRGRTPRTDVMFGPPGRLYVYFTYGMHFCANVVTGRDGEGSAVLLRAVEPLEGLDAMEERRGTANPRLLCAGPGRLCEAFGVGGAQNGTDLVTGDELRIEWGSPVGDDEIAVGPRVGLTVAVEQPWRFVVATSRYLSRAAVYRATIRPPRVRLRGSPKP